MATIIPKAFVYLRYSSAAQKAGDSVNRQIDRAKKYCEHNDLQFSEDQVFKDEGVSGFDGGNLKGELGKFVELVNSGDIPAGSFLIVESLDRLSRAAGMAALNTIQMLVNSGIKIVNLQHEPPKIIDSSQTAFDLMLIVVEQARAHDESLAKSKRSKANWKQKRAKAAEQVLTSRVPLWLRLAEERKIVLIPERARIVLNIFEWAESGLGKRAIAKRLNEKKIKTWGRSQFWNASYVGKILDNRAVCGEYQPHETIRDDSTGEKRRKPVGPPITDYYPSVITEALFRRVMLKRKALPNPSGRKGRSFSNLFAGFGKCYECGSSMRYINKGAPPKGGQYLVCSRALNGGGCHNHHWRYDRAEELALEQCDELDFSEILGKPKQVKELKQKQDELADLLEDLAKLDTRIEYIQMQLSDPDSNLDEVLASPAIKELSTRKNTLEAELEEQKMQIEQISSRIDAANSGHELKDLLKAIEVKDELKRYEVRSKLNQILRSVLEVVEFDFLGLKKQSPESEWVQETETPILITTPATPQLHLKFNSGGKKLVIFSIGYGLDIGRNPKENRQSKE